MSHDKLCAKGRAMRLYRSYTVPLYYLAYNGGRLDQIPYTLSSESSRAAPVHLWWVFYYDTSRCVRELGN